MNGINNKINSNKLSVFVNGDFVVGFGISSFE